MIINIIYTILIYLVCIYDNCGMHSKPDVIFQAEKLLMSSTVIPRPNTWPLIYENHSTLRVRNTCLTWRDRFQAGSISSLYFFTQVSESVFSRRCVDRVVGNNEEHQNMSLYNTYLVEILTCSLKITFSNITAV